MNSALFGFEMNVWLDAAARLGIITGLMTVVVMGLIYLERKVTARFQMRLGPTRTGPMGMLQSLADALKLVGKEDLRPAGADPWVFELAVYFVFIPIFMMFVAIPFAFGHSWRGNVRLTSPTSSRIDSGGQTTPQAPQSMHRSASMTWIVLRSPVIASVGQRLVQAVQPMQVSMMVYGTRGSSVPRR